MSNKYYIRYHNDTAVLYDENHKVIKKHSGKNLCKLIKFIKSKEKEK